MERKNIIYTVNENPVEQAPRCPGVYRFFNKTGALLYVGKSIDIASRLASHFGDAVTGNRQHRMMSSVYHIDCELTAGDAGAQLLENAAIKTENPFYNRRQRRSRKLWTQKVSESKDGFLRVIASDFCTSDDRRETVFGLFRSRHHIDENLRKLAREHQLCTKMLGIEKGKGACFQYQVGRCAGACAGIESPHDHNKRLLKALNQQKITAWPFEAAVLLEEKPTARQHDQQPTRQYHLLNHWCYLGSFRRKDQALRKAASDDPLEFDRDSYRIALRILREGHCKVLCAEHAKPLINPFLSRLSEIS